MTPTLLYRIAAVVLLLFAAGHTFGFMTFKPTSAEGLAVLTAMNSVHFEQDGATFSYGRFYEGLGLTVTTFLLFSSYLAWHLGRVARSQPHSIGMLAWIFAALQVVCLILSWIFISPIPAIFSTLVFVSLGLAAWLLPSAKEQV